MLGLESQYRLRDFLKQVARLELKTEAIRQELANLPEFEPYAAFCRINRKCDKLVRAQEIHCFLQ